MLSPRNGSLVLSPPDGIIHGVSIVENNVIVSSKNKLLMYRISRHANDVAIASVPSVLHLTSSIEISWQQGDVFVCNSKNQSYLFYLSTHTQTAIRPSRCCWRLAPSVVVVGGDEGLFVYQNDLLTQTISTPSSVLAITSSSASPSLLFVGCRDGDVYRWEVGSHSLQWQCHCRHAIVSLAAIGECVCVVDAGGCVKLNRSLVGLRGARRVCSDESNAFVVALENEIVCLDCAGVVYSSLPLREIRFLLCTESVLLASDASELHIHSKPGYSIHSN